MQIKVSLCLTAGAIQPKEKNSYNIQNHYMNVARKGDFAKKIIKYAYRMEFIV